MLLALLFISILSSLSMGFMAYYVGMEAKRWGMLGLVLGPIAYPLFNTHKLLKDRKVASYTDIKLKL